MSETWSGPLTLLFTDDHLLIIAVILIPLGARGAIRLVRYGLWFDDVAGARQVSARGGGRGQTLGGRRKGGRVWGQATVGGQSFPRQRLKGEHRSFTTSVYVKYYSGASNERQP